MRLYSKALTKWIAECMLTAVFVCGIAVTALAQTSASNTNPAPSKLRALPTGTKAWKGDFDDMVKRWHIRIAVPYSRTLYFNDHGRERGIVADNARDFEGYINKKYRKKLGNRPITVYLIPTTRDLLVQKVADGLADIAAGNLTVIEERKKLLDFVAPEDQKRVSEVVVTSLKAPPLASADDLSGKTVHVRKASSYYESLNAFNSRLKKEGRPEVKLVFVPDDKWFNNVEIVTAEKGGYRTDHLRAQHFQVLHGLQADARSRRNAEKGARGGQATGRKILKVA